MIGMNIHICKTSRKGQTMKLHEKSNIEFLYLLLIYYFSLSLSLYTFYFLLWISIFSNHCSYFSFCLWYRIVEDDNNFNFGFNKIGRLIIWFIRGVSFSGSEIYVIRFDLYTGLAQNSRDLQSQKISTETNARVRQVLHIQFHMWLRASAVV